MEMISLGLRILLVLILQVLFCNLSFSFGKELTYYCHDHQSDFPSGTTFSWGEKNITPVIEFSGQKLKFLKYIPPVISNKDSTIWMKIPIDSKMLGGVNSIVVPNCHINKIQFFALNDLGQIIDSTHLMGDRVAFAQRAVHFPEYIYALPENKQFSHVLIFMDKSNEPFYTSIQANSEDEIEVRKRNFFLLSAIVLGILLAVFIINLYIVFKSRVVINYLYSIFIALCIIYTLADFGYCHWIVNYNSAYVIDIIRPLSLAVAFPIYLFFFIRTINLSTHYPKLTGYLKTYGAIWMSYVIIAASISPFLYDQSYKYYSLSLSLIFQQLSLIIMIIVAIVSVRKKIKYALPFLVASFLFVVTHFQYVLHRFGLVDDSVFEQHFVPIILALDCLIIARIVAVKFIDFLQENKTLQVNLKNKEIEITERIAEIQLRELSRISQLLHNHIGAELISLKSKIDFEKENIPQELFEILDEKTIHLIEDVRNTAHFLSPQILKKFGLSHCLNLFILEITKTKNIEPYVEIQTECDQIPLSIQLIVLLTIQECVNNTTKHAHASQIQVQCFVQDNQIFISYSDNGVGFEIDSSLHHGIGLVQIREMIFVCKGEIQMQSSTNQGFQLDANIPFYL